MASPARGGRGAAPAAPPAAPRVTMRDVANRAGVSQPLVSMVIGGHPGTRVSEATRQRILAAARELGYRPNVVARALVQGRSFAIGVIIPDLRNPFLAGVVSGIERVAADRGYAVLLCDSTEAPAARHLEALQARQTDGIILDAEAAAALPADALAEVKAVLVEGAGSRHLHVTSDAATGGRLAAEHLLVLGHHRIGYLGPAGEVGAVRARERGFIRTLRLAGHPPLAHDLRRAPATLEGGRAAMQAVLSRPDRPTAVFCATDLMALGALKACVTAGLAVPGEMSIVGCDNIDTARVVSPELTTVAIPARELGIGATRLLLRLIDGETVRAPQPLPVHLVVRGTTGPRARA